MPRIRVLRFEKELLKIISSTLEVKMRDKYLEFVAITAVKLSNDLSHAKIYYTHLDQHPRARVQETLEKASGQLKNEIARTKLMRRIPELTFIFDELEEKARKIDQLFNLIKTDSSGSESTS
ncbi:MAG: 30S ribosome-binding factor RbfA [Candidatus Cloacimonetes bacterium]|nr:30S ribosome-binding factor RbfA [Candidatus Cloacimonadota bacterium]